MLSRYGTFSQTSELTRGGAYSVSLDRLLAHAGFDARQAIRFWENRGKGPQTADCTAVQANTTPLLTRLIMGDQHPDSQLRVQVLKDELSRWEREKKAALAQKSK